MGAEEYLNTPHRANTRVSFTVIPTLRQMCKMCQVKLNEKNVGSSFLYDSPTPAFPPACLAYKYTFTSTSLSLLRGGERVKKPW